MHMMEPPPLRVKRSRNRKVKTCLECRRLKRKCTKTQPCTHCIKTARECVYPSPGFNSVGKGAKATLLSISGRSDSGSFVSGQDDPRSRDAPGVFIPRLLESSSGRSSDMCLLVGRLNITERIGGLRRSEIVPYLENLLSKRPETVNGANFDQMSAPIMTWFKPHMPLPLGRLLAGVTSGMNEDIYIDLTEMQWDLLRERFFLAVHPICPLFTNEDLDESDGFSNAMRLATSYAAVVSMPIIDCKRLLGESKEVIVRKLKAATEDALCRIDIFNCFELRMFQAVIIYLTPQFLGEISRSQSVMIAAVCRHFQIAGYAQDVPHFHAAQQQLRRHLWHHILFLCIRATETVGPESTLVDDPQAQAQLPDTNFFSSPQHHSSSIPHEPALALIRYECYMVHRMIFRERENLKYGKITFPAAMRMVDNARDRIRRTYMDSLDFRVPLQRYASAVGKILLARAEGMMLHTQLQDLKNSVDPVNIRNR
jgi:hypothetical protein